ncbi:G1 family glutamic endopeptidase [Bacillus thuringiensis]
MEKMDGLANERDSLLKTCGMSLSNWSGYSIKGGDTELTSISAEWTVPNVTPSSTGQDTFSATWIGLSGPPSDTNNIANIIQVGTSQFILNNKPVFYAWLELYPAPPENFCKQGTTNCVNNLPFNNMPANIGDTLPVKAGDLIRASIQKMPFNNNRWRLFLMNSTQGWGISNIRQYNDSSGTPLKHSFADFILENPSKPPNELANYGAVTFKKCRVNGINANFSNDQSIAMVFNSSSSIVAVGQNGDIISIASEPSNSGDTFSISFGANKPPSP